MRHQKCTNTCLTTTNITHGIAYCVLLWPMWDHVLMLLLSSSFWNEIRLFSSVLVQNSHFHLAHEKFTCKLFLKLVYSLCIIFFKLSILFIFFDLLAWIHSQPFYIIIWCYIALFLLYLFQFSIPRWLLSQYDVFLIFMLLNFLL